MKSRLAIIFVFVLISVGLEVGSRLALPFANRTPLSRPNSTHVAEFAPNLSIEWISSHYTPRKGIEFHTEDLGYRDDRDNYTDRPVIAVVEDSHMAGMFLGFEQSHTERLEVHLAEQYHAVNLGVPGSGPDQNYLRLGSEHGRLAPRIIIFHLYADNDAGDLIRAGCAAS